MYTYTHSLMQDCKNYFVTRKLWTFHIHIPPALRELKIKDIYKIYETTKRARGVQKENLYRIAIAKINLD